MSMAWKFVEGLTVADVAFEASGSTMEKLFESAAEAVTATMVREVKSVKALKTKKFSLSEENEEKLLFEFLQKLVFYKDAELLLFSKCEVKTSGGAKSKKNGENNFLKLNAVLKGERIDAKKHELLVDVKAVTWHKFELKKTARGWKAQVILDV